MKLHRAARLGFALLLAAGLAFQEAATGVQVLDPDLHHLGDDETPDWSEAPADPEGTRLDLEFEPDSALGDQVLIVEQRHVDDRWAILVNGLEVGTLDRAAARGDHHYPLPEGVLRSGRNTLSIVPDVPTDDIVVGHLRLDPRPLRQVLALRTLELRVVDADTGRPVPARVTIASPDGELPRLRSVVGTATAVRPGVVYTDGTGVRLEVPEGRYEVWATRGAEWSRGRESVLIESAGADVELGIRRTVDTRGFVAVDTHVHTVTHSGHGDATMAERMITLAGEGVEVAVATDHNHNTDYRPLQRSMGLEARFTSVTGNEVTTDLGHFNAFPLDPADEVPDFELGDHVALVDEMRAHGAEVVILNHPRWPAHEQGPFGVAGLDRNTGARANPLPITFDAMELVNSTFAEPDPLDLFDDWFALLDRGERVLAVGSSDSHTVGEPVGQGRTYVRSPTDDPASVHVETLCENLRAGRSSIGMGIFCDVTVTGDGRGSMGDLVRAPGGRADVSLRVAAPAWVRPERALVFANGLLVGERRDGLASAGALDTRLDWQLELQPDHDAWIVCVVLGPAADGPAWPSTNAYTLAATNPVWLDVDGDGVYTSPRASATRLVETFGTTDAGVEAALARSDGAVALHVLDRVREAWLAELQARLVLAGGLAADSDGKIEAWLESLAPALR